MSLQGGHATTVGTGKQIKRQVVAAACGLGVTVATLAGIGAWQASVHQGTIGLGHAPVAAVQQTVKSDSAQIATGGAGRAYYLVASEAQAKLVRAELEARAPGQDGAGNLVLRIVDSPEEEARMLALIDADLESANHGGPVPQIYDLRTSDRR
jgi:hypothetical protein